LLGKADLRFCYASTRIFLWIQRLLQWYMYILLKHLLEYNSHMYTTMVGWAACEEAKADAGSQWENSHDTFSV